MASTFPPERYLRRNMANWGGFFGGSGQVLYQMCSSPRLDNHLVSCLVLTIQPDTQRAAVKLVDLVYPERQLFG